MMAISTLKTIGIIILVVLLVVCCSILSAYLGYKHGSKLAKHDTTQIPNQSNDSSLGNTLPSPSSASWVCTIGTKQSISRTGSNIIIRAECDPGFEINDVLSGKDNDIPILVEMRFDGKEAWTTEQQQNYTTYINTMVDAYQQNRDDMQLSTSTFSDQRTISTTANLAPIVSPYLPTSEDEKGADDDQNQWKIQLIKWVALVHSCKPSTTFSMELDQPLLPWITQLRSKLEIDSVKEGDVSIAMILEQLKHTGDIPNIAVTWAGQIQNVPNYGTLSSTSAQNGSDISQSTPTVPGFTSSADSFISNLMCRSHLKFHLEFPEMIDLLRNLPIPILPMTQVDLGKACELFESMIQPVWANLECINVTVRVHGLVVSLCIQT